MPFAITSEQHYFFKTHHFIEFEELLSSAQVTTLKQSADKALAGKLGIPVERLCKENPLQLFQSGYHLHLTEQTVKRVSHKPAFAGILADLTRLPTIRFGFDQYILISHESCPPFPQALSLEQTSCLSPLAGALILPLKDLESPLDFFPLPQKAGNALFLSPSFPIPWPQLFSTEEELSVLLIGFAHQKTFFKANTTDPLAGELKKLGYAFNDLLRDPLHPLLYTGRN